MDNTLLTCSFSLYAFPQIPCFFLIVQFSYNWYIHTYISQDLHFRALFHQVLCFEASGILVLLTVWRKQVLKLIFQKEQVNSLNPLNLAWFWIRSLEGFFYFIVFFSACIWSIFFVCAWGEEVSFQGSRNLFRNSYM